MGLKRYHWNDKNGTDLFQGRIMKRTTVTFQGMNLETSRGIAMPVSRIDRGHLLLYDYLGTSRAGGNLLVPDAGYGPLLPLARLYDSPVFLEANLRAYRLLTSNCDENGVTGVDARLSDGCSALGSAEKFDRIAWLYHPHYGNDYIREMLVRGADLLSRDGAFLLCGRKDKGIVRFEQFMKTIFKRTERVLSKGGYRIVSGREPLDTIEPPRQFKDFTFTSRSVTIKLRSSTGLFSVGKIDPGTALLLEALPDRSESFSPVDVLDLGCGSGIIGIFAASLLGKVSVDFADVDLRAVRCTEWNCRLNNIERATVYHSDGIRDVNGSREYDLILTHPPVHSGKDLPETFIRAASGRLRKHGIMYLVAAAGERFLKPLQEHVGTTGKIIEKHPYILFKAIKKKG